MSKIVVTTYEHWSTSLEEVICCECKLGFEENQERCTKITVRQEGENVSEAKIVIQSIHVNQCLPGRKYKAEKRVLSQVRLAKRHSQLLEGRDHDFKYQWLVQNHLSLVNCINDYEQGIMQFVPAWQRTFPNNPAYRLVLPTDAHVTISKQFFTYEQFKNQFTRMYVVDASVVETNAETELQLPNYFSDWKQRVEALTKENKLKCDLVAWTHVEPQVDNNKADVHFIVLVSLPEDQIKLWYKQNQADDDFPWSHLVPLDLNIDPTQQGWLQCLYRGQHVLNRIWTLIEKSMAPSAVHNTRSASVVDVDMKMLASQQSIQLADTTGRLVQMNVQVRSASNVYYLIDSNSERLWRCRGELQDAIPIVVEDDRLLAREIDIANLSFDKMNLLFRRVEIKNGQLLAKSKSTAPQRAKLIPTL